MRVGEETLDGYKIFKVIIIEIKKRHFSKEHKILILALLYRVN